MSDRKLKLWLNTLLNQVATETTDNREQIALIRALAEQLTTEAASLEIVASGKEVDRVRA